MNTIKTNIRHLKLSLFLFLLIIGIQYNPITAQNKIDTLVINTSAQCSMCKERIEKALAYEKGVKSSNLDLETKAVTVIYNSTKTTANKIKIAISKVGHDADDIIADQAAYDKLPECCKKPEDPNAAPHSH